MRQPRLRTGEAHRQQEDGRSRLPSNDAPGGELAPVAHPLHVPFDHQAVTSGAQEVCMQRVRDRKSTRLNSSHITTSYAVFCLKKKNATRKLNRARMGSTATNGRRIAARPG